ncbi:MAG: NAD(P)-dependent oxidoreductase [Pseudomonadota bacterium]
MAQIGFIGLGLMGSAMVQRLLDCGHDLVVLGNRDRTGVEAALARGAQEVQSARALAEAVDTVMLCMGTSEHVEGRMRGEDGVMAGLRDGAVVVDFGTSLPASTKALAAEVAALGGSYLDAPLGRTPAHALDGALNIMCAGDPTGFEKVRPLLDDLGENVFHLGASGTGHTVKLLNNFFGMTVANAMAEAFGMADMAGVDRKDLYDVMSAGPLHSGMMDFVAAYGLEGDPNKLQFSIANATKDVGYYRRMAQDLGTESLVSGGPFAGLSGAVEAGHGDKMVSQIVDYYADRLKG